MTILCRTRVADSKLPECADSHGKSKAAVVMALRLAEGIVFHIMRQIESAVAEDRRNHDHTFGVLAFSADLPSLRFDHCCMGVLSRLRPQESLAKYLWQSFEVHLGHSLAVHYRAKVACLDRFSF